MSIGVLFPALVRRPKWNGLVPTQSEFAALAKQYKEALLADILPFWELHAPDREHGGYFSELGRFGAVEGTDKYMWQLSRQVWLFSMLYNRFEKRASWLKHAALGATFLQKHGQAADGSWHFAVTRAGEPLDWPHEIYSDCFAAMALSQYAMATKDEAVGDVARHTFDSIIDQMPIPGIQAGERDKDDNTLLELRLPMVVANVAMELEWMIDSDRYDRTVSTCLDQIFDTFLDPKRMLLHENVSRAGAFVDSPAGRLNAPGHALEAMWFAMAIAERSSRQDIIQKASEVVLQTMDFGWDHEKGGLFTYLDLGEEALEYRIWDQKRLWVHSEALVALIMAYRLTGKDAHLDWFRRVHDYAWERFPDPEYHEWFPYLNRDGHVLTEVKADIWKGCFHLPRAVYRCTRELELLAGSIDE